MTCECDVYSRMIARNDVWAQQSTKADDKGKYPYFKQEKPLTREIFDKSLLTNKITIGCYTINPSDNCVKNPMIDIDSHDGKLSESDIRTQVKKICDLLVSWGAYPYTEASSGTIDQGAHIGLICKPTPAKDAKELLTKVLSDTGLRGHEVYPKQSEVSETSFGNLTKLPFQYNNRSKVRSTILNPVTFEPMERQTAIDYLLALPDTDITGINNKLNFDEPTTEEVKNETQEELKNESTFTDIDTFLANPKIKPCISQAYKKRRQLHGIGGEGNDFRVAAITELTSWDATDEQLHKYFEIQTDYDKVKTQTNINWAKGKTPTSCKKIKEKCPTLLEGNCATCNYYLKPKRKEEREVKKEPKEENETEPEKEQFKPEIIKKANDILTNKDPVKFIMSVYNEIHVGDITTGMVLLGAFGSQCVLNSAGLQPKLSGKTGKGKSHAVSTVLHLLPQADVLESSLSDKAIYHSNLKAGTIIYSDDVEASYELQGVIKRSTTNFQKETKHTITVKKDGIFTGMSLSIPPRIVWCLTSVNDNGSMEYLNRQFNLGVDESEIQDDAVMKKQLHQAANAEIEFPINDNVLTCRAIFKILREKTYRVSIPFAECIEWHDPSNRRNISQFLDLIKSFAVYNQRKRTITSEGIIEATEDDFKTALSLYSVRAINQKFKLNDNEIRLLSKMKNGIGYDIKALQDLTGLSYATIYRMFKGRDGKTGLLEKVPALQYQPETEIIGETTTEDSGGYEYDRTCTKKTKPHEIYTLHEDFNNLSAYSQVASLKKVQ